MADTPLLAGVWFRWPVPIGSHCICATCGARADWLLDRPYDLEKTSPAKPACDKHGLTFTLWAERHHDATVKHFADNRASTPLGSKE